MDTEQAADQRLGESMFKDLSSTGKGRMCSLQDCPAPTHSKKWRIVSKKTSAGNRNWTWMIGQTLCDSCYSSFRKHGTFVRSVRTAGGWFRTTFSVSPLAPGGDKLITRLPPTVTKLHHTQPAQRYETEDAPNTDSRMPGAQLALSGFSTSSKRSGPSRKPSEKQKGIMEGSIHFLPLADIAHLGSRPPEANKGSLACAPFWMHLPVSMDIDDCLDEASLSNAQSGNFVDADVSELESADGTNTSTHHNNHMSPALEPDDDMQRLGTASLEELESVLEAQHRAFFLSVFADNAET